MDKLKAFETFASVATRGSLSAAARAEGVAPAVVSRRLDALEEHLGVKLLVRTTRRIALTHEGTAFLDDCQRILAEVAGAEASVSAGGVQASGHLRVTAPAGFGRRHVAPLVPEFHALHPRLRISLNLSDRVVDLAAEGYDCAVRVGDLPDSSLISIRLADNQRLCVAAPAYLARWGTPKTPDDLVEHNCLWITSLPALRRWPFDTDDGIRVVPIDGNVVANNAETVLQLAIAGVGITRLTDIIVGGAIRRGELVPILTDWHHVEPVPLFATYPSGRHLSPKIRAMVDFLVAEFGDDKHPRGGRKAAPAR